MQLQIRLFATLRDKAGTDRLSVEVPAGATVTDLLARVRADHPGLADALYTCVVAVNREFADPGAVLTEGDEVALFPPVSGGAADEAPYPTHFALSEAMPDMNAIRSRLTQPDVGAVVFFVGAVRGETERAGMPSRTNYLEYEAYEAMALERMGQIAREIWDRFPAVRGVAIVQRLGRLDVGDITTLVACAAGHRDEDVFEAARYGIDRLKEIVPVWKREVGPDGSAWVEGYYHPTGEDNSSGS